MSETVQNYEEDGRRDARTLRERKGMTNRLKVPREKKFKLGTAARSHGPIFIPHSSKSESGQIKGGEHSSRTSDLHKVGSESFVVTRLVNRVFP